MIKRIIMLFCIATTFLGIEAGIRVARLQDPWKSSKIETYEQLKDVFTQQMYSRSGGILPFASYKSMVDHFLKEAETQLHSLDYCKKYPQKALSHRLMHEVMNFAVTDFNRRVIGLKADRMMTGLGVIKSQGKLMWTLSEIIKSINSKSKEKFDADAELGALIKLIQDANNAYYKAMPWYTKFAIYLQS